jgi:hypothetical protein
LIQSVNLPETGDWGKAAQVLLLQLKETPDAGKRGDKALKLIPKDQWMGIG